MACILADLDIAAVWAEAEERERRVLVENLLAWIKVLPDHLDVKVVSSPPINVQYSEVRGWTKGNGECWCRRPGVNPHAERICTLKIPRNFSRTIPTPPDRIPSNLRRFRHHQTDPTVRTLL